MPKIQLCSKSYNLNKKSPQWLVRSLNFMSEKSGIVYLTFFNGYQNKYLVWVYIFWSYFSKLNRILYLVILIIIKKLRSKEVNSVKIMPLT